MPPGKADLISKFKLMDSKANNFPIQEKANDIKIPQIKYKRVAYIESDKVFTGDITPIPSVLVDYLDKCELRIFAIVLRSIREKGFCIIRMEDIAKVLNISFVSASSAMTRLKKMGIIEYSSYGKRKDKSINFATVQRLSEILQDKKLGAAAALRKKVNHSNINRLSQSALDYLEKNYSWNDDPLEDEEYN